MRSLLFIDHIYHKTTQSSFFLQNILKSHYNITLFYWDPYYPHKYQLRSLKEKNYDVVVCWQILPPRRELDQAVTFRRGVFFPMFDAIPPLHQIQWYEYRDFQIINFCKFLHEKLLQRGFSTHYIQYFPQPSSSFPRGEDTSAFFWQRCRKINFSLLEHLLSQSNIGHIHWHAVPDPQQNLSGPSNTWKIEISRSEWFVTKQDLLNTMAQSALYIAPRDQEGIGQSFLEAMAMGRCVIAPDSPTMNEYITHGKTGFLYSLKSPTSLQLKDIHKIQLNTLNFMDSGHKNWQKNFNMILDWISEPPHINKKELKKCYMYSQQQNYIFGIPFGAKYCQKDQWKYVWPHKKVQFFSIFNSNQKFSIRLFGIQIFKIKKSGKNQ